jgi:hypothetical protein
MTLDRKTRQRLRVRRAKALRERCGGPASTPGQYGNFLMVRTEDGNKLLRVPLEMVARQSESVLLALGKACGNSLVSDDRVVDAFTATFGPACETYGLKRSVPPWRRHMRNARDLAP